MNVEAVSAILKEGTLISIKLAGSLSWSGSIVYKSNGRILYIALTDKYINEGMKPGDSISVKYFNEYFIYAFEGTVAKIAREYPSYAALRMTSAEEVINSRLSPRFDVYLEASLKSVWDSDIYPATITDISFGGAAFYSSRALDCNEELDFDIRLHQDQSIKARGKIIRKNKKSKMTEYSMQFTQMDEGSCRTLSLYFSHIEEEAGCMYEFYLTQIKQKNCRFSC